MHKYVAHEILTILLALFVVICRGDPTASEREITAAVGAGFSDSAPLEWARRFAQSIRNDEYDRGRALGRVAEAWVERGEPNRALEVLPEAERGHWAVLSAMAETAACFAANGEMEKARALISEIRQRSDTVRGSARDRVLVQLAYALALAGEDDVVKAMFQRYFDLRDYRGEAAAKRAVALARSGRIEEALAQLGLIEADTFYDSRVWLARGYIRLAPYLKGTSAQRVSQVLKEAWDRAQRVADQQRFLLQAQIVEALNALGEREEAVRRLREASAALPDPTPAPHLYAPVLARFAAAWGALGQQDECAREIARAEDLIARLQNIEQPELKAMVAEAWMRAARSDRALAGYLDAIAAAEKLENPRPRALAGLAIALSLNQSGCRAPEIVEPMERLVCSLEL